ncbi:O-antigen ligase family protein [Pedobacter alpinus]
MFIIFFEIHLIAYRFSILNIYLLIIIYCFKEFFIRKKFKYFLGILVLIGVIILGINTIPSVEKRLQNSIIDLKSITENENPNYQSVGQRWAAVKCAFEVIKAHPILGVSPADAKFEMQKQYEKNSYLLIPENRIFIHNQFIYLVLSFGIPFSLLFILFLTLEIYKKIKTNALFIWLIIPFVFHMMLENTLERQITINTFVFLFFMVNAIKQKPHQLI